MTDQPSIEDLEDRISSYGYKYSEPTLIQDVSELADRAEAAEAEAKKLREALHKADKEAEVGLCQFSHSGARACLTRIRRIANGLGIQGGATALESTDGD